MNYLLTFTAAIAISIATFFGTLSLLPQSEELGATTSEFVGGQTYTLAGSGITSSATSIILTSLTITQTGQPLVDSDFSSIFYATLEPGNTSRQEFISCTTVTQGATSATLSGCSRGLSPISPYTASTTLQFAHAGGSKLIFSNSPQAYANQFLLANSVSTSTDIVFFSSTSPPRLDSKAAQHGGSLIATTSEFATVGYVNAVALSGSPNASEAVKGVVDLATALQQASSTFTGISSSLLVLQAKHATDTPQRGCAVGYTGTSGAGCSVIAQLTGKIRQTWINLTEAYTWTGLHTFTATTTMATSTIASATITSLSVSNGIAGIATTTDIQTFTTSGTWTKPTGAKVVEVYVFGSGGGGGSGARHVTASSADGGSGGGGGAFGYKNFNSNAIGTTETVTIGAVGTGGVARTGSDQPGNNGTNGGNSSFGSLVVAPGGSAGLAGTHIGSAGGAGGVVGNGTVTQVGGAGGASPDDIWGETGVDTSNGVSPRGGGGGGSASGNRAGGAGGSFTTYYVKTGGAVGVAGSTTSSDLIYGGVGGGGGSGGSGVGGVTGGAGGSPGGGGGGGGGHTSTSGAGASGALGMVIVITYF